MIFHEGAKVSVRIDVLTEISQRQLDFLKSRDNCCFANGTVLDIDANTDKILVDFNSDFLGLITGMWIPHKDVYIRAVGPDMDL